MSKYIIQGGRYKGAYKTKWTFTNRAEAILYYIGLNVGNGYKKRLIDPNGKVIARTISQR